MAKLSVLRRNTLGLPCAPRFATSPVERADMPGNRDAAR